ncbi:hypothetical protein [Natrialba aegyptia]|uniref:DUF8159 domain-containing protein n=1 Tax=Natrialba aegyptia DSM 13077 TaxID=1227491 RepID=M0B7I8_9EURY|nr:hypothetical protein [Natrialba aegyptia]ELZ06785.1 hypothetical protein C480_07127 [Natrialba aegyptia DSM 13077]
MSNLKNAEPSDDYLAEFDGSESREDLVSMAVQKDDKMVKKAAGFADLLDDTDVDVDRVAVSEPGQIDVFYTSRGESPEDLGADIEEIAIHFAALFAGGTALGRLEAAGDLGEDQTLCWHIRGKLAAQCARDDLEPKEYVERVASTTRTEVNS